MTYLKILVTMLIFASAIAAQEPPPDWSKKTFSAAPDAVFSAALSSIANQHHEIKSKDELNHVVTFHVGVTAWSWGYNMILKVTPGANETSDVVVEVARSGGKTVSWGSGKKEVEKIFKGINKELAKGPSRTS